MPSAIQRDDFNSTTKAALAKRSAFLCVICRAITVGPSAESAHSISNVGVAAHITAAAPGGPRYDATLTRAARSDISNGIWLCQTHAKLIDDDCVQWTASKLREIKRRHEEYVKRTIGMPGWPHAQVVGEDKDQEANFIKPREFAFIHVRALIPPYKSVLGPMLLDRGLTEDTELGILMSEYDLEGSGGHRKKMPWTVFVKADWLRWFLNGESSGYNIAREVPPEQIYGVMPAWPDSFFEFLEAIVQTNTTFEWRRHPDGYLVLSQSSL
jgi:hypothetical protein